MAIFPFKGPHLPVPSHAWSFRVGNRVFHCYNMVTLEIGAFPLLRGCCPCSLRGAVICLVMVPVLVSQGSTSDLTYLLGRRWGRRNTDYCPAWTTWPYAGALSQGYTGSPSLGLDLHSGLYRAHGATEVRAQGLPEVPSERARCLHRPPQALVLTRDFLLCLPLPRFWVCRPLASLTVRWPAHDFISFNRPCSLPGSHSSPREWDKAKASLCTSYSGHHWAGRNSVTAV